VTAVSQGIVVIARDQALINTIHRHPPDDRTDKYCDHDRYDHFELDPTQFQKVNVSATDDEIDKE
jgi:hypothetical protein